jgi:hypothetical protein
MKDINDGILAFFIENNSYQKVIEEALAFSRVHGKHGKWPYHNTEHCSLVALHALNYARNETTLADKLTIALAGIFHDFDHSGRPLSKVSDSENISAAIRGLYLFEKSMDPFSSGTLPEMLFKTTEDIIRSTEVVMDDVVTFPVFPSILGMYIRDADVTMMAWGDSIHTLEGLAVEMNVPYDQNFLDKSETYMSEVKLYTSAANEIRNLSSYYTPAVSINIKS